MKVKKEKQRGLAYSVYCNPEDYEVIRKLQDKHSINISNAVRVFLKKKLEQLEKMENLENVNPNI